MISLDLEWIRAQFPALSQTEQGHSVVFLDGPGGTQVPGAVIDAMANYLTTSNANSHGHFRTSRRTDAMVAEARGAIADLLGCAAEEVIFGANMTTLTFAFSRAIGRALQPGDEVVVTTLDHDANVSAWMALQERGVKIRTVDIHVEDCTLDLAHLQTLLNERTKVVAVGYASNAVGTINDVAKISRLAHQVGAWVYVDAVHYAPHGAIDVRALDCDFLTCSAYKFFGPHLGILYGKRELLDRLSPYKVRPSSDNSPERWETGTLSFEALAGTIATIHYLAKLGRHFQPQVASQREAIVVAMAAIRSHEQTLLKYLISNLLQVPGISIYGITDPAHFDRRTPTVAIRLQGHSPGELAQALGDRGIYTWHGNFHALNLSERLQVESLGGFLRIGLVHYNRIEEVQYLLDALQDIAAPLALSSR
jgi:cysteine desulfurase family protein (TIGR01976 family)